MKEKQSIIKQVEECLVKEIENMTPKEAKEYLNARVGVFPVKEFHFQELNDAMEKTHLCRRMIVLLHKEHPELFDKPMKSIDDFIHDLEDIE